MIKNFKTACQAAAEEVGAIITPPQSYGKAETMSDEDWQKAKNTFKKLLTTTKDLVD